MRAATRASHDAVDAAFGDFDLSNRDAYCRFLVAHASALPVAEAAVQHLDFARTLPPRTPLLERDLADLGTAMPAPLPFPHLDEPGWWGALYVVEGSRLGGVMLARSVAADLPSRYLAAAHAPGQWRDIRHAIDAAGADRSTEWRAAMLAGAAATFELYATAAQVMHHDAPRSSLITNADTTLATDLT